VKTDPEARKLRLVPMLLLAVLVLPAGCAAVPEEIDSDGRAAEGTTVGDRPLCETYDSFAGRAVVGNPARSNPSVLVPVEPGQSLEPSTSLSLGSVSLGRPQEADALTFEVLGDGFLGWSVRFVQSPHTHESGEPTDVAGTCILQIDLNGFGVDTDDSKSSAPERLTPAEPSSVVEALRYPNIDGISQTFLGTRTSAPKVSVDSVPIDDGVAVTVSVVS
jgi:hypothetical protein